MSLRLNTSLLIGLLASLALHADEFAAYRNQVQALSELRAAPAVIDARGFASTDKLKAIYFDALAANGNPTKVFAWLGLPDTSQGKVPGIVLVHGGGGTAFKEWVARWNAQGFAAISIATEGQTDQRQPAKPGEKRGGWAKHAWPGPARSGIYHDSDKPLKEQWMYHATADTILANSLLRSLPQVDAGKVGLMGISWGGVIASTVVGIDTRFAFAIPTYGCGNLADAGNQYGRSLGANAMYRQVWDPMKRLARAQVPMLWFSWPQDSHFPLDCQAASYRTARGPRMLSLVPRMGHGHGPPWKRPESYAFAKAIVHTTEPWCQQTTVDHSGRVAFSSTCPFTSATLVSTTDSGVTGSRKWRETPAILEREGEQWAASAPLPPETNAWFINLKSGDIIVSSEYQEAPQATSSGEPDPMWTYKKIGDKELQLSVFLPEGYASAPSAFPTIAIFHGGSWRSGEPNWHYPDCVYWSQRGMIAVSVDYRLKNRDGVDVPLACVQDAKSAIRFLRQHAQRLKIDPTRIVAAGGSAGGQLAAATATITSPTSNHPDDDSSISCRPDAIVLYNPWFKCTDALNPLKHLSADLPPIITFSGGQDEAIPVSEMQAAHRAYTDNGASSALYIGNTGGHGFCNGRNPRNPFFYWALEHADQFLVRHTILHGPSQVSYPPGVSRLASDAYQVLQ
ncbi:MAG: acetyl esterase/lipase [Rhodothermales bacterium]|jgi:acetyl esterase/lipase